MKIIELHLLFHKIATFVKRKDFKKLTNHRSAFFLFGLNVARVFGFVRSQVNSNWLAHAHS